MHMDTGELHRCLTDEDIAEMERVVRITEEEMQVVEPLPRLLRPKALIDFRKNKYRNRPCLCGSGKKFKKCCVNEDADTLNAMLANLQGE